jgi:hypothetical protein
MAIDTSQFFAPLPEFQPRRRDNGITLSDVGKSALSGAQELVGSLGAIPEAIGAASGSRPLERIGQEFRQKHQQAVQERTASLSPAGQQAFDSGIGDVGVFGFGGDVPLSRFLAIQGARALPSTAAAGVGGLGIRAATRGAIGLGAGSVATEAGLSAAGGASNQASSIENRSTANLLQTSQAFRDAYAKYDGLPDNERDAQARSELKGQAMLTGATGNALATLGGSALAGRLLKGSAGGVFDESVTASTGLLKAGTKGAGREAVQEFSQSALESIAQDLTTGTFVDPSAAKLDNLLVNALESAVEGAVIGAAVGGTIGGVTGQVNATREARMEKAEQRRNELAAAEREKAAETSEPAVPQPAKAPTDVDDKKVARIVEGVNTYGRTDDDGNLIETLPPSVIGSANRATLQAAARQVGLDVEGVSDADLIFGLRRKAGDTSVLRAAEEARLEQVRTAVQDANKNRVDALIQNAVTVEDDVLQPSKQALARIKKNLNAATDEERISGLNATIEQFAKNRNNPDNADVARRVLAQLTGEAQPISREDRQIAEALAASASIQEPTGELTREALAARGDFLPDLDLTEVAPLLPDSEIALNREEKAPLPKLEGVPKAPRIPASRETPLPTVEVDATVEAEPLAAQGIPQTQVEERAPQAPENSGLIEDEVIPNFEINGKTVPASVTDMKADRSLKKAALFKYGRDNGIDVKAKDTRDTLIEKLVASTEPPVEGDTGPIDFSTNEDSTPTQGEAIAAALGESDTDDKAPPVTGQTEANLGVENVNEINDKQTEANLGTGALPERLTNAADRDAARTLLAGEVKTKQDHVKLAKALDIHVTSRDTKQQIADKIIEVTVGARLKTEAIRGDTLRREPKSQQQAGQESTSAPRNFLEGLTPADLYTDSRLLPNPNQASEENTETAENTGVQPGTSLLVIEQAKRQITPPTLVNLVKSRFVDAPGLGMVNVQDTDQLLKLPRKDLDRVATGAGVRKPQNYATLPLIAEMQTEGTGYSSVLTNAKTLQLLAQSRQPQPRLKTVATAPQLTSELTNEEVAEFVADIKSGADALVVEDLATQSDADVERIIAAMEVKAINNREKLVRRAQAEIVKRAVTDGLHTETAQQIVAVAGRPDLNAISAKLKIKQAGLMTDVLREKILAKIPVTESTRLVLRTRPQDNFRFHHEEQSLVPGVSDNLLKRLVKELTPQQEQALVEIIQSHPDVVSHAINAGLIDNTPPAEMVQNAVDTIELRESLLNEYTRPSADFEQGGDVVAAHRAAMESTRLNTIPDLRSGVGIADPADPKQPLSRSQILEAITPLQRKGGPVIRIAESVDQLPKAGQELVANIDKGHLTRGMFLSRDATGQQDQIWLLAENIHSPREAVFVALHEAAHKGLRTVFGSRMNRALLDIYDRNQLVRDRVKQYQADLLNSRTGEARTALQNSPMTLKLTAIEEVLADMAKVGEARSVNLFSRIYNAVSQWLYDVFGINFNLTDTAVEEIVAGATEAGLAADSQVLNAQRPTAPLAPDIRLSSKPNTSPAQAMDKVDGILSSLAKAVDNYKPAVTGWLNRRGLELSTGNFLASYHARIFNQEVQDAITQQNRAERVASATVAKHGKDLSAREQEMARLPEKSQAVFNELAGESTRLGIYPNKPFRNQPWLHDENESKNRQLYNKLQTMYNQPGIAAVYDKAIAHNERDLEMTYGSLLRSVAFTFEVPKDRWREVNPQDAVSDDAKVRMRFKNAVTQLEREVINTGGEPARLTIQNMRDFRASRLQGPYFHLGRHGDYFVQYDIAKNPEAQQAVQAMLKETGLRSEAFVSEDADHVFNRFETYSSWVTQDRALKQLQAAGHIDKVSSGKIEENISKLDFSNVGFMQNVLVKIDTNTNLDEEFREQTKELIRRTMVEMLPEMSGGKALARRKGTPGYSLDMRRNFVKRSRANMFFVAQNTAQPEVMEALKSFRAEITAMRQDPTADPRVREMAQDMFNHIKKRHNNALKPLSTPTLDHLSSIGYSMFLASNIPYIVANMAQPFQTTLPVLGGKFGFTKTASTMFNTYQSISKVLKDTVSQGWVDGKGWKGVLDAHIIVDRAGLSKQQTRALHILVDSGVVEFTQAHGLARVEQGADARSSGVAVKLFGAMSHYSEAANRLVTGLAAFNLEYERLKKLNPEASDDQRVLDAARFAEFTIDRTQFNYDPANRGYAFSKNGIFGKLTPLFTGFMQFNMQMIQLLVDLSTQAFGNASLEDKIAARRSLAGMMVATMTLAGAMGLPFMTAIAAVYNGLGDDDDPRELRADFTHFLSDMLGPDAANMIAHGAIDPLTGTTLSTRLSLGDLLPASEFLRDRREFSDKLDSLALSTLGPSIGAMTNIGVGAMKMADGDIFKGMAMMLPAALQGFVKGPDLLMNGYTDMKGNKLPIAATDWEIMTQFLNFTPAIKTEFQRNARSFTTQQRLLAARKTELGRDMVKAIESGDRDAINAKAAELIAFQTRNPDHGDFDLARIVTNQQRKLDLAQVLQTPGATSVRDAYRLQTAFSGLPTAALRERLAEGR